MTKELSREELNELVVDACKGCFLIFHCGFRVEDDIDIRKCYSYKEYEEPTNEGTTL